MSVSRGSIAAGLALGWCADRLFADPRRGHPVAGFGSVAGALERLAYADRASRGAAYAGTLIAGTIALGAGMQRMTRGSRIARIAATGLSTWAVVGGRSLGREATQIAAYLERGDLEGARRQVRNLVGRDPSGLDAAQIARAALESVAENTSDAVVAPLLWGGIAGIPGLLGYRAINTLDAMVGHKSDRYRKFGWAAARIDDIANFLPARAAAAYTALAGPAFGASVRQVLTVVRRDARRHPSPNAGPVEAAFAGALGVTLGGVNEYAGQREDRGTLGDGPAPTPEDIVRAVKLSEIVSVAALVTAVVIGVRR
ncbi:adenosylcobinamide-phosphate synthase [Antricoccus suffuscus]|uniref:Cobalamin biosynthesis protein CobD n=1 Tax=Antricoccus suffuscus TaxID=1629062 RepID=A0A2T0ZZS6_9ACTN|nr:cobalamin biosynthesis protein [Antricoccus suffuscus]PRZ41747.1 adenosylcobinamide-phosphate synthase [Antricoccus suffuscus]